MTDNNEYLLYQKIDLSGDFPLSIDVPLWFDILDFETDELLNFIMKNIYSKNLHKLDMEGQTKKYWSTQNIFDLDIDSITVLKEKIYLSYLKFVKTHNKPDRQSLYINGWVSILEPDNYVIKHCHSLDQNSYLSGFLNLQPANKSVTLFHLPQMEYMENVGTMSIENLKNQLVMFPQWLFHSVPSSNTGLRIDIGFDIFTKEAIDYYHAHNLDKDLPIKRAIKFYE